MTASARLAATTRASTRNDTQRGGDGNDSISALGTDGAHTLLGGAGNDTLKGRGQRLRLEGGEGDDSLSADTSLVKLTDTTVVKDQGSATLLGGVGNDTLKGTGKSLHLDGGDGDDVLSTDGSFLYVGVMSAFTRGDATLSGGAGNDHLAARNVGSALMSGGDGDDKLSITADLGRIGNVTMQGGAGRDTLDGSCWYTTGGFSADGGADDDLIKLFLGFSAQATLIGGSGNDSLLSDSGQDLTLEGGSGNDILSAGAATSDWVVIGSMSTLYTPTQQARLSGGSGNDTLSASFVETATLSGGTGTDTFVLTHAQFMTATGGNTVQPLEITDFKPGKGGDVLDLTELLTRSATGLDGGDPFAGGFLKLVQSGADTLVQFDADGSTGVVNALRTLAVLRGVDAAKLSSVNLSPGFAPPGTTVTGRHLRGSDAAETLNGGGGSDHIQAGGGNDQVDGGVGRDVINGGAGNDMLTGSFGDDTLHGDAGDDQLSDDLGHNLLDGGDGADRLSAHSGTGVQTLLGGAGNDTLEGTGQSLLLDGGADNDVLDTSDWEPVKDLFVSFRTRIPGASDTLRGGSGDDKLSASFVDTVRLSGDDGNDRLTALAPQNATLLGGAGQDTLDCGGSAGTGKTTYSLDGGAGNDLVTLHDDGASGWPPTVKATHAEATLAGGSGDDVLTLVGAASTFPGLSTLTARLDGGEGNDTLTASQVASATLVGGSGDDLLIAEAGVDELTGGGGHDVFRFTDWLSLGLDQTRDRITDFTRGQDKIDLSALDANPDAAGDQAFRFVTKNFGSAPGQLSYANGVLALNTDTDPDAEYQIQLVGQVPKHLSAPDFIL